MVDNIMNKNRIQIWRGGSAPRDLTISFLYFRHPSTNLRSVGCTIELLDGYYFTTILRGISVCSKQDSFVKEIGRKISLKRAIQSLSKDQRKQIWDVYLQRKL